MPIIDDPPLMVSQYPKFPVFFDLPNSSYDCQWIYLPDSLRPHQNVANAELVLLVWGLDIIYLSFLLVFYAFCSGFIVDVKRKFKVSKLQTSTLLKNAISHYYYNLCLFVYLIL